MAPRPVPAKTGLFFRVIRATPPIPVFVKSTPPLFQGSDAVSSALSYLKQNSDISN